MGLTTGVRTATNPALILGKVPNLFDSALSNDPWILRDSRQSAHTLGRIALEIVIAWIVGLLVAVSPIGRAQYYPDAKENTEATTARYTSITNDLIDVVYDPAEKPLFTGPKGRAQTVMVLLAIASFESGGFRKDVDLGLGKYAKGDGGRSWCLEQVQLSQAGPNGKTARRILVHPNGTFSFTTDPNQGWGGEDLVKDRKKCFRAGLAVARASFGACGNIETKDKLKAYAAGNCSDDGVAASRSRMGLAMRWMTSKMPTFTDSEVLAWKAAASAPKTASNEPLN